MAIPGVVRFVAVLSAGLIAGILFEDRMGATFARPALSVSSFVTFQQVLHVHFVRMMPILMGTAILFSVAWVLLVRSRFRSAEFVFAALAALALISVSVLTRAINVPINVQLMAWDASAPPADVMNVWARWEQAHTVRTVMAVLGFALGILALGTAKNSRAA